jgi:phage-related protein
MPDDWRSMPDVGQGVNEVRVRTTRAYRVFYIAKFEEAVYVLHVFEKRTQKTAERDIDVGRQRLADVLRARRRH